jgi:hypothetical protein
MGTRVGTWFGQCSCRLPVLFLLPGFNMTLGGTLVSTSVMDWHGVVHRMVRNDKAASRGGASQQRTNGTSTRIIQNCT